MQIQDTASEGQAKLIYDIGLVVLGTLLGYYFPKVLSLWRQWRTTVRWSSVDKSYTLINRLTGRLSIVQTGWHSGAFKDDHIKISLAGNYQLPADVESTLLEPRRLEWERAGFKDNQQCGVNSIAIVRTTDDGLRERDATAHEILISAHTYRYFQAKASNFERLNSTTHHLLEQHFENANHDSPAAMPNPLSVGLSLFCEGGRALAVTRRTISAGAGGHVAGGLVYNAVGESCAPVDTFGEVGERTRLSIFRTAARGLLEEMGIDLRQASPVLHTFCWDRVIMDFKFFGYVVSDLSYREVENLWRTATDKSENRQLIRLEIASKASVLRVVEDLLNPSKTWAPEARLCTIMSLLHAQRLSLTDLLALAKRAPVQ